MNREVTQEMLLDFPPYEVEELTKEEILGDTVLNYLAGLEDSVGKIMAIERVKDRAKDLHITSAFNKALKQRDKEMSIAKKVALKSDKPIIFPDLDKPEYNTSRYELDETGNIYEVIPDFGRYLVCHHPILPVERYKNLEDGTEKIKLMFYKNGKWESLIVDKETICNNQKIIGLSNYGINVTSETAKFLVKYLDDVENMNQDKIITNKSVSRMGWINGDFVPYSSNYLYAGDISFQSKFKAVSEYGEYEIWKKAMKELRKNNLTLRFIIASSFASALVKLLNINSFIVHLWGKSDTGKTVALMIGASIWGNPTKKALLNTMNNTEVGTELLCNFFHNIPVMLDELQLIKTPSANYDNFIYTVTEGKGKARGNKDCNVRNTSEWQNIIITSGEEPITSSNSKEGVKNRVIEIEENSTIIENGIEVVDIITNNYGFAGKEFINIIRNRTTLLNEYKEIVSILGSEVSAKKQVASISAILLADRIISELIFKDNSISIDEAKQYFTKDIDEADRYINLIIDIANSKINYFEDDRNPENKYGDILGKIERDNSGEIKYYYFIPAKLRQILNEHNISWDGIKQKLAQKSYVYRDGKNREYTKNTKVNGTQQRVVVIKNIYYGK